MKVSIVVIFDQFREEKLKRLLASVKPQLQGKKDVEILLLHESNVPRPAPKGLPMKVRYLTIPEKRGIPFNRNQGIIHARGNILIFIDDDCWVQEKWLSSLLVQFKDPKVMVATSGTKIPPANFLGDCISALGFPGGGSLGFENVWPVSAEGYTKHMAAGNCAIQRKVFERVGTFDEDLKLGAEDAEFSLRLEKAGIRIKYVPEAYAYHEARTTVGSFIRWQLRRGRANYHFRRKVGRVSSLVRLRLWSASNVLRHNANHRLPFILLLLGMSFSLQQGGYFQERWHHG